MRLLPRFFTTLTITSLLLAAGAPLGAKTIKFPKDDPGIIFDVPDDWTIEQKSDSTVLLCKSASGIAIVVFLALPGVSSIDELKSSLKEWAKSTSEEMADVSMSEVTAGKTGPGMPLSLLSVKAKQDGEEMICVFAGFSPAKGKYFAVSCIAPPAAYKDGGEATGFDAVLDSVKAIK